MFLHQFPTNIQQNLLTRTHDYILFSSAQLHLLLFHACCSHTTTAGFHTYCIYVVPNSCLFSHPAATWTNVLNHSQCGFYFFNKSYTVILLVGSPTNPKGKIPPGQSSTGQLYRFSYLLEVNPSVF